MKTFDHKWDNITYLLHIQLTRPGERVSDECEARIGRRYASGREADAVVDVQPGVESHRFIVSRTHPDEVSLRIEYPAEVVLEAFEIDDRAYYPTQSFYVG